MLKITVHDTPGACRIQLEGKLTAPWVTELEDCWRAAESKLHGRALEVDLTDVDYADAAGRYLLGWMRERGARLIAPSLAMQDLVRQITLALLLILLVLPAKAQEPVLRLTMKRAVEIAVSPEGNAHLQIAGEAVKQADARAAQARSVLLPDLEGTASWLSMTRNLEAFGLGFGSIVPGIQAPSFVGPFNVLDARVSVRQSVLDLSSIKRYQSARTLAGGVRSDHAHTADAVAATVARTYVAALKADADVASANANVELAKALQKLIERQKDAGTGTGIEVTRARVQLANEQQRLLVATNERRKAHLQLLRAVGLRLDTRLELDEKLSYTPATATNVERSEEARTGTPGRLSKRRQSVNRPRGSQAVARVGSACQPLARLPITAPAEQRSPTHCRRGPMVYR